MRSSYKRFLLVINSSWKPLIVASLLSSLVYTATRLVTIGSIDHVINHATSDCTTEKLYRITQPGNFRFSRDDLRLEFKQLPNQDLSNWTYDNYAEFPCTKSKEELETTSINDTEDIMCIQRPQYLDKFKNPCFLATLTPEMKKVETFCHPYFHILGFDKCGTTDFHSRLVSHPEITNNLGGWGKEIYFWSWYRYGFFEKGPTEKWPLWKYKVRFPNKQITEQLTKHNVQLITGDATPLDAWDFRFWQDDPQNRGLEEARFLIPHAMRHIYKNPKFILLLRNPVERTYSDYMFIGNGFTPEKFAVDVPKAISIITDCLRTHSVRQCFFSEEMFTKLPMRLHISCYSVFLREWFSVFDRQHFLVVRTEDYHSNTTEYMKEAFHFLDVAALTESELEKISGVSIKHETKVKKTAGPMLPETREMLKELFARFNEDLVSLLGDNRFLWQDFN